MVSVGSEEDEEEATPISGRERAKIGLMGWIGGGTAGSTSSSLPSNC